jgi:hypothetical protein
LTVFREEFYEQESETVAFLKLEGTEYFQGKRSASDYCDHFMKLVCEAGMTDRRMIVSKFRRGLRGDVAEDVSKDISLILDDPNLWYHKAKDFELVAKFNRAYHDTHTVDHRSTNFSTPANFAALAPSSDTSSITTTTEVHMTDMPEEDVSALAKIGLEVVGEEQESLGKDFCWGRLQRVYKLCHLRIVFLYYL